MVIHDMRNPTNSIEYGVKKILERIIVYKERTIEIRHVIDQVKLATFKFREQFDNHIDQMVN